MMARPEETDAPHPKRARLSSGTSAVSPAASETTSGTKLRARDVVELRFVKRVADIGDGAIGKHDPAKTYSPTFLHQIFLNEEIEGYSSATLAVYVDPLTLSIWLHECTEPLQGNIKRTSLRSKLARFIKGGLCSTRADFEHVLRSRHTYVPPVTNLINEYTAGGNSFGMFKEDLSSTAVKKLHRRICFFMFLHIDGASFLDDSDPRWELFLVYRLNNGAPREFVGYATMYPFAALRNEQNIDAGFGERLRISQVFVMPQYQGREHEARLLEAVSDDAVRRKALEVTVEDPSPQFSLVRDLTDLRRAYRNGILHYKTTLPYERVGEVISDLCATLRITRKQARRCVEVHKLIHVDFEDLTESRRYRLWVKRRLCRDFVDLLDFHERKDGKEAKKAKLAELFEDCKAEYAKVIDRLANRGALSRTY